MKKFLLIMFLMPCYCTNGYGQQYNVHPLSIGDSVVGLPPFKYIVNSPAKNLTLNDLHGKLVIIDFWSTGCPACIASIPHLEQLQKQFAGRLQIIMVNPWESHQKIMQRVSRLKILRPGIGLTTLPNVLGDTIWRVIFPHADLPHHVWIDPKGKVIASTTSINTTAEHIQEVLDGIHITLSLKNDLKVRGYDVRKRGLMQPGDTALKPFCYSAFFKSNLGYGAGSARITDTVHKLFKWMIYNRPVLEMYETAFQTTRVLLAVKDTTGYYAPKDPNKFDEWFDNDCYSYEIAVPTSLKDSTLIYMRSDLNRFFGIAKRIRATMVKKPCLTYTLKKINDNIIEKQIAKKDTVFETNSTYVFQNVPFLTVISSLRSTIEDIPHSIAFSDKTNISNNTRVTITLPKNSMNKKELRSMLAKQGLGLTMADQPIDMLVIADISNNIP